jgi:hypothetical protein
MVRLYAISNTHGELKIKINEEKDRSFHNYITSLNRFNNTIWKPMKHGKKRKQQVLPIRDDWIILK